MNKIETESAGLNEYPPKMPAVVVTSQQAQPQEANRYYTPVCVEIYVNNTLRYIKWFSDLQMAYIYCMNQRELAPTEDWQTPYGNFPAFADQMDHIWARREEFVSPSLCALYAEGTQVIEFVLCYEPDART